MQEFSSGTMNDRIFKLSSPYANPYQGSYPRWLFVCSAGLLRSPTGAAVAIKHNINARACGANMSVALIPISANLVAWADKIIFVCPEVRDLALELFKDSGELYYQIDLKGETLDIPDIFEYMHPDLVEWFERELFN